MNRLLIWAPFLLLGPVTGPLSAGALFYARRGRWGMAVVCAIGIIAFWVLGPSVLAALLAYIIGHGRR